MREAVKLQFSDAMVRRQAVARDWREAVKIAGGLLVQARCARPTYPARLVEVIEKYGPYMVLAPGLALVHAQPGSDSIRGGLAAATFPDGVNFGHAHYDPVGLVIAITTTNTSEHLEVVAGIANALDDDPQLVTHAVRAPDDQQLVALLRAHMPGLVLQ